MGWCARVLTAGVAVWALSAPARAGEHLQYGPAADWVRPIKPAAAAHEVAKADHAVTNRSIQVRYDDDATRIYSETLVRIQTARGLGAGRPTVEWDPVEETVTINKAELIRGGRVIDLLGRGQTFVTLRREADLEQAMINGELTAVLQPDGVEVGDTIDFAYTLTRHSDVLGHMSEDLWSDLGSDPVGHRDYRFSWPAAKPLHWRLSDDLPVPDIVTANGETELSLDMDHYDLPPTPDQAPGRYSRIGEIQVSQFETWPQVSAFMAPYYDQAARLAPDSPLKAEVARIRTLSQDPKVQAAAALHLVEQKVRYLHVTGSDDGFIPPPADLTWLRRWGDCKAKTALLTALLRELGIAAAPALVDIGDGDGKDERLPALALFDHIIVRAVIDGQVYWLDGTDESDGTLDQIGMPNEKWALPLTGAGETLQPLIQPAPAVPLRERHIDLDASAGLDVPAKAHLEVIVRGAAALEANADWQEMQPEQADAKLRLYWRKLYPWIDIGSLDESFDPATAEMHFVMDGTAHMEWSQGKAGDPRFYETDGYEVVNAPKPPVRPKGLHDDAPVVVSGFPAYARSTETIRLPDGGKGFAIAGDAVDETLAGVALKRTFAIRDGIFSMETTTRTVAPEVPLAEALAAAGRQKALSESQVFLQSPGAIADSGGNAGAPAANGSPAAAVAGPAAVAAGTDALWATPFSRGKGGRQTALPEAGAAPVTTLDELVRLYSGYKRN
jgi:hypothetical protein